MSSIPFSTVTSMLGTSAVARQVAGAHDKNLDEQIRAQRVTAAANATSREEVHDPGDNDVRHVHDEDRRNADQQQHHKRQGSEEQVYIAGIAVDAPSEAKPSLGRLDISA